MIHTKKLKDVSELIEKLESLNDDEVVIDINERNSIVIKSSN
jgi:hypothetical protein